MNLAEELKEQALRSARDRAGREDGLGTLRRRGLQALEEAEFPGRKSEAWKYTSLRALEEGHLHRLAGEAGEVVLPDFGGYHLVFLNGRFSETHSSLPDEPGLQVLRLNGTQEADVEATREPLSPFAWLNTAALEDGLLLRVADNTRIETPLHVCFISDGDSPSTCHTRLHLELGAHSRLELIEHYSGRGPVLTNAVTELHIGRESELCHYRIQSEQQETLHIGSLLLEADRDSRLRSFQLMQGNRLRRNEVRAVLRDTGAELDMGGVFIGHGQSHVDNQVCVEHRVPHCQSRQNYKGIAGGKARVVFNGRIHIHPHAQGSRADLSNKNLLLGREAEVDTKPELEIYNDDVQCSHGTTVGQLDGDALYYLRTRGVSEAEARRMLGLGFINERLLALPRESIAEWARPWLGAPLTELP